jgi:hypothetical protein
VGAKLAWVLVVWALRFFVHAAPVLPAAVAAPPPEDQLAAAAEERGDTSSDDPSDVDDDDLDDEDVALSARIAPMVPPAAVVRPAWSIRSLADKHIRDPLFRPPRHA